MLEQRIDQVLARSRSVLLAGCGGGYDVFGALPLLSSLRAAGKQVHLASLAFTYLNGLDGAELHRAAPNLYRVPASAATRRSYCPEAWLAGFLEETLGEPWCVWGFDRTGVVPLARAYQILVRELGVDTIVLVDGGVDSLLRGDETSLGTPAEDLCSLAAVAQLEGTTRLLACVGFGAELRDGILHEQVFARIAELTRLGAFLGTSALDLRTPGGELYERALAHTFAGQEGKRTSHVHTIVRASARGEYGETAPQVWLSPLLSLYWYFSLPEVASSHLLLDGIAATWTLAEVTQALDERRAQQSVRAPTRVPL